MRFFFLSLLLLPFPGGEPIAVLNRSLSRHFHQRTWGNISSLLMPGLMNEKSDFEKKTSQSLDKIKQKNHILSLFLIGGLVRNGVALVLLGKIKKGVPYEKNFMDGLFSSSFSFNWWDMVAYG
jgi:hypothetical protein